MFDELRAMAVFAKTIETGSFRGAAKILGLSPSVVSHHISSLEQKLGLTLLYRSTRKMSLTAEGKKLYEASKKMLEAAKLGIDSIIPSTDMPSGTLRISIASLLGRSTLMEKIAQFSNSYPNITLQINFTDKIVDLIEEGIDIAIRIGTLKDSSLKAKKIQTLNRKLVCSPVFLKKQAKITKPEDLSNLRWIGLEMLPESRVFKNSAGTRIKINYKASITVDSVDAACQLAIEGAGISTPADFLVKEHLKSGKLVEILPNWKMEPLNVYAIWPQNLLKENLASCFKKFLI